MGRAFEYRKARKMKRWGHMARVFTKIGKEIEIAVKAGGPDPTANTRLRILMQNAKAENILRRMLSVLLSVQPTRMQQIIRRLYTRDMVLTALHSS